MTTPPTASLRNILHRLEDLRAAGVTHLPKPAAPLQLAAAPPSAAQSRTAQDAAVNARAEHVDQAPAASAAARAPSQASLLDASSSAPLPAADRPAALKVIADEVAACTRCAELAAGRTQTVFGAGNPNARLAFLGEAPGADEDRQGEPFVGRAGKLLTDIIEKGLRLNRSDVYIFNVLKCRPPGNRNPAADEAENCRSFLDRQLEIIRPEFLVCLGSVAAQNLLNTGDSIARLRGRFFDYLGARVLCTYHPAYLLRNPAAKRQVWDDMQIVMQAMGIPVENK